MARTKNKPFVRESHEGWCMGPEGIRVSATARDKWGYSSDGRVVISRYRAVDCATRLQRHRRVSAMARADGRPT